MNKKPYCKICGKRLNMIATRQSTNPEKSYWLCKGCLTVHESLVVRNSDGKWTGVKDLKVIAMFEDNHYVKPE